MKEIGSIKLQLPIPKSQEKKITKTPRAISSRDLITNNNNNYIVNRYGYTELKKIGEESHSPKHSKKQKVQIDSDFSK